MNSIYSVAVFFGVFCWMDSSNDFRWWNLRWCTLNGEAGSNWNPMWGGLEEYWNQGFSALEACCANWLRFIDSCARFGFWWLLEFVNGIYIYIYYILYILIYIYIHIYAISWNIMSINFTYREHIVYIIYIYNHIHMNSVHEPAWFLLNP